MGLEALARQELDTDVLDTLVESGLARRADSDAYDVHDLIREFLLRSMAPSLKIEFHQRCSEWYKHHSENQDLLIEHIYHCIQSEQHEEASELVVKDGRTLVAVGHLELLGLIEQIDMSELALDTVLNLSQLKGEMMALLGRFDDAEHVLQGAFDQTDDTSLILRAQLLSSMADVSRKQGNSDLALTRHKQALKHYVELNDALWASRTYNNIGYLLRRKKERGKALEAYAEVEAILDSNQDPTLLASQITLARALIDLDELDRAKVHALTAYEQTQDCDDPGLHARAQSVLGRYYARMNQAELAMFHYTAALESMNEAGDLQSLVEVTMLLGGVLQDAGKTEEALDHYQQALVVAEANDMRMQIGELLTRIGGTSSVRQERMEYLQRALSVFRELGARSRMKEVQTMVHRAVMGR